MNSNILRIISVIIGILTIIYGLYILSDVNYKGFPYGEKTEYDRTVDIPFNALGLVSILFSVYFFKLSYVANKQNISNKIICATILYLIIVPGLFYGIEYYLKKFTDINYGQGG